MWRYLVGGAAALLLAGAGMFFFRGSATTERPVLPALPGAAAQAGAEPLPAEVPAASDRTREQKRFDRYDKDRNDAVSRDEYLAARRKAFAKLDLDHDGRLSFDEWAAKSIGKFAAADGDKSGTLSRTEFAATAPKRKGAARPRCADAPAAKPEPAGAGDD
jgi:hypothetical protein